MLPFGGDAFSLSLFVSPFPDVCRTLSCPHRLLTRDMSFNISQIEFHDLNSAMPDKTDIGTEMAFYATLEGWQPVRHFAMAKLFLFSAGRINSRLKRTMRRGVANARALPARRRTYSLTPQWFAGRKRLVALFLGQSIIVFREAWAEYAYLFVPIGRWGRREVVCTSRDELAEFGIATAR